MESQDLGWEGPRRSSCSKCVLAHSGWGLEAEEKPHCSHQRELFAAFFINAGVKRDHTFLTIYIPLPELRGQVDREQGIKPEDTVLEHATAFVSMYA